jgi:hypothetical protein
MPKRVCGTWLDSIDTRAMMHVLRLGRFSRGRCKATAIKTTRGVAVPASWWTLNGAKDARG